MYVHSSALECVPSHVPAPTFMLLLLCNNSNAKVETGAQD